MALIASPTVAWVLLGISGLLEIVFATSVHLSQGFTKPLPAASALFFGALSVYLMSLSLKFIPIGTAYAVWGGIGAVGTVVMGLVAFGESGSLLRLACIGLIVAGTIGLQFQEGQ
ncbi:MAG: multidrug efflux SMR transporter [Dehalococcoidia bacterium]